MSPTTQTVAGIGIDIVDLERFASAKYVDRVAEYILTERERGWMNTSRDPIQYLASRFAAKEAVIKSIPLPLGYQDIEVRKDGLRPVVSLQRADAEAYRVEISISHCPAYAVSSAISFVDAAL